MADLLPQFNLKLELNNCYREENRPRPVNSKTKLLLREASDAKNYLIYVLRFCILLKFYFGKMWYMFLIL